MTDVHKTIRNVGGKFVAFALFVIMANHLAEVASWSAEQTATIAFGFEVLFVFLLTEVGDKLAEIFPGSTKPAPHIAVASMLFYGAYSAFQSGVFGQHTNFAILMNVAFGCLALLSAVNVSNTAKNWLDGKLAGLLPQRGVN